MKSKRIESIDLLRGLVMIIMALDHARAYLHYGGPPADPTDLETTFPFLFFTRFITHFCAPVFVFLAGTSAYLYGQKKSKNQLGKFLFTRGVWLIFLELVVNNLIWFFDPKYEFINLQVLWAIGFSMIALSAIIQLPKRLILLIGIVIVAGHNLLDGIVVEGHGVLSYLWYFIHQHQLLPISESRIIYFNYPILPWIGVMALGYCFGEFYRKGFSEASRKKWLLRIGIGSIVLFFILRGINVYGNLTPWEVQEDGVFTILSFMNLTKYPPSLLFVLFTIGGGILFLRYIENIKNRATDVLLVFGRVAFFYYFLHMLFIHIAAIFILIFSDQDWRIMFIDAEVVMSGDMADYGFPLWVPYVVWILVVAALYPICKWYMNYKANNRDKWWLSYL